MSLIPKEQIDFWISNRLNVLFKGHAGVGKTHFILDAFKRHNLKYQYYSCSTLDPYIDFIGIPREVDDGNGNKFLDFVRPKQWANDEIDVLFLDEFNRSKQAVRNAVMELIQFKSINGKKFNNLKMIWAAINPDDDEDVTYDVEKLDPAQQDRFHIHYEIPYKPDFDFFSETHGSAVAKIAIEWWNSLDKSIQMIVSPRRLHYALQIYKMGGDINFVLPIKSNPKSLKSQLESVSIIEQIEKFLDVNFNNIEAIKNFFTHEKNCHYGIPYVLKNKKSWDKILPNLPFENLNSIIISKENKKIIEHMINNSDCYMEYFKEIEKLPDDVNLKKYIEKEIVSNYIKKEIVYSDTPKNLIDLFKIDIKEEKEKENQNENEKELFQWLTAKINLINKSKTSKGFSIGTAKKISLVKEYYELTTQKLGNNIRSKDLIDKEALFLKTIANIMQVKTFKKIFDNNQNLVDFYTIPANVLKKKYIVIYTTHFAEIFSEK
jgi:hypothetical protein